MATPTQTATAPEQVQAVEEKLARVRALFADAPEVGKKALANVLGELRSQVSEPKTRMVSAGRVGSRQGQVAELTIVAPLAPGGARRLRALLRLLNGGFDGADRVGTLHDMRFVFLDEDTTLLFATTYDGEWDAYIDDFATKIPDYLDILAVAFEGWPGIRSPEAKDFLAKYQITADGWYVADPDVTVAEIKRLRRIGTALDTFLDKLGQ
jgi:hypothetical protein